MIKKIMLLVLCMALISSGAYASLIAENVIAPTEWNYPYLQNGNIKLETHFDMWNNDNDAEPCEAFFCNNQAYDYVLDPATDEIIGRWSMFKLQRKQGNDWKNLQIIDHRYEDCSTPEKACMKRVMRLNENTYMNVTYELKENDNKVKFTIDINSGLNREYRLKYRLLSNENINYTEEKKAVFGDYFYDWNDITNLTTESIVSEDGLTLDQITYIGLLDKDETITIDPLIATTITIAGDSTTNLLRASDGTLWFYAKTATKRNMYKSIDEGVTWTLNATTATNYTTNINYVSVIDSNNDIRIIDDGNLYTIFDTSASTFTDSDPAISLNDYDVAKVAAIGEDDTISVIGTSDAMQCTAYKRTSGGVWSNAVLDADSCSARNTLFTAVTDDHIIYGHKDSGSTTYMRFYVKLKSDLSAVNSSYDTFSTAYDSSSGTLVDYANNYAIMCGNDIVAPNVVVNCLAWNGSAIINFDEVLTATILGTPVNSWMARNSENIYMLFATDNAIPYLTKMNATDFAGGVLDFDWTNPILLDIFAIDTGTNSLQFSSDVSDDQLRFAYVRNSDSDWYYDDFPKDIVIQTYDEETGTAIADWDLTISNSTDTDTKTAIDSYYGEWSDLTTIRVSKTGYAYRFYYINLTANNTPYYLNAYLLNSSSGNYVRFHIYDQNSNTKTGASVTAYKFIGGVYTPVEIGMTDGSGTATLFLDPVVSYRIGVTQENCTDLNTTLTPTSEDYAIQLTCAGGGALVNYTAEYTGFTWEIWPTATGLCNTTTQDFYVYLNDTESLLGSYSVNLTNSTGSSLWSDSGSVAGGENMSTTENLASYTGGEVLTLTLIVNRSTFSAEKTFTHKYYVWDWNCADDGAYNTSLMSIVNKINAGTWEIDNTYLLLICLFISIAAAGLTFAVAGVGGGGASVIFLLTFGTLNTLFNFMDWGVFGLIVMGALAVAFIR